jgi:hypothetical protein
MAQLVGDGDGDAVSAGIGEAVTTDAVGDADVLAVGPPPVFGGRPHPTRISDIAPMTSSRSPFIPDHITVHDDRRFRGGCRQFAV